MVGDDAVGPRETEAAMTALGREKGIHHLRQHVCRDAGAGVVDFDANVSAGLKRDAPVFRGSAELTVLRGDRERALCADGLNRIVENLLQRLRQLGLAERRGELAGL